MPTRRDFVLGSGALAVAVALPLREALAGGSAAVPAFVNAYLEISPDGGVRLHSPTTEMGQGTHTGHAVIIADELGVNLERVSVVTAEPADPFRRNGQMGSGGSWGVRHWYQPLRKATAQAREVLIAAAAAEWAVPVGDCRLEAGEVVHAASGRRAGIGTLAGAAAKLALPENPPLRPKSELRYTGRKVPRVDLGPKVRGEPVFASDVERPGMVYACASLAPVFGAELEGFDRASATKVPGVLDVVAIPGGAAVVATSSWAAMRGVESLALRFKPTAHDRLDSATISRQMRTALADGTPIMAREDGDWTAVAKAAQRVVSADYEVPYLAHAPMEPWNCTVEIAGDGTVHIWAPVQTQDRNRDAAAAAAGVPPGKVRLHTTLLGGGFGRRLGSDGIAAAVVTAQSVKKPVKFFWRRADEFGQGWYRPAQVARLEAALDAEGRVTGLRVRTAGPSLGNSFSPQGLPAGQLDGSSVQTLRESRYRPPGAFHVGWVRVDQPVPMAPWRSVGATQNGYFLECFVDEVARAAGRDPLELRRELLAHDPRALRVIDTVAKAAGWGAPLPTGRARGIACVESYGSLCAQVAEVSLREGRPVVHRVVCALDCGSIVLPDGVRSQVEGGIVQGLSAAMGEAVHIEGGQAKDRNFDTYPLLRIGDAPESIETIIIESGEAMGGVGEPPVPPIAPAVVNALAALTGRPIRELPLSRHRLA